MALVTNIEPNDRGHRSAQKPTRCFGSVIDADGQRFVQLNTFRLRDIEATGDPSQNMRFDRQSAGQLIALIREAFPDLL